MDNMENQTSFMNINRYIPILLVAAVAAAEKPKNLINFVIKKKKKIR